MASDHPEPFKFLVDVNLPKRFGFFNSPLFTHVADINPKMTDLEIWDYALKNELVILTKDSDFYDKMMTSYIAPKIIFFQLGNCTLRELHRILSDSWDSIIDKLSANSMVILRRDQMVTIE